MNKVTVFLLLCLWFAGDFSDGRNYNQRDKLLVVSFDGFRSDYLNADLTPNLMQVAEAGAFSDGMRPVFPSKTFTNHFSLATGLYAETHGVTVPHLHDTQHGDEPLEYGQELFGQHFWVEPLWIANQEMGGSSGVLMWSGGQFEYGEYNTTADKFIAYNHSVEADEKIEQAFEWLRECNLVMLYFDQPDFEEHIYGADTERSLAMVRRTDDIVGRIWSRLRTANGGNRTNVVFVSDHGMASTKESRFINVTGALWPGAVRVYGSSPVLQLVPRHANETELIVRRLREAARRLGHFSVYRNEELPERWHFAGNAERVGPITLVADVGYAFEDMFETVAFYERTYNVTRSANRTYGIHGYDNAHRLMRTMFVAAGPMIRPTEGSVGPFDNVELFQLFWRLLGYSELYVPLNNGTLDGQLMWDRIVDDTYQAAPDDWMSWISLRVNEHTTALWVFLIVLGLLVLMLDIRRSIRNYNNSMAGNRNNNGRFGGRSIENHKLKLIV